MDRIPPLDPEQDAILLDFDGTLVEIAPRPDAVVVPEGLGRLLNDLSRQGGGALALVSGRAIADIADFLPDYAGAVVGSHGAESRGLDGMAPSLPTDGIEEVHRRLDAFAAESGLLAEHKPMGAAIHFRARPEAEAEARAFMQELLAEMEGFALQPAHMAFELKPAGASKDRAIEMLMASPPFAGRRPVFAGDDDTDEPALDWVRRAGGLSIRLGGGGSAAEYRMAGPAEMIRWLEAGRAGTGPAPAMTDQEGRP